MGPVIRNLFFGAAKKTPNMFSQASKNNVKVTSVSLKVMREFTKDIEIKEQRKATQEGLNFIKKNNNQ